MSEVGERMTTAELRLGLRSFAELSNARGFATIAVDWLMIAAAACFWRFVENSTQSIPLRLGAWLIEIAVLANRIRALESLTHEATHATLFRTRRWNVTL